MTDKGNWTPIFSLFWPKNAFFVIDFGPFLKTSIFEFIEFVFCKAIILLGLSNTIRVKIVIYDGNLLPVFDHDCILISINTRLFLLIIEKSAFWDFIEKRDNSMLPLNLILGFYDKSVQTIYITLLCDLWFRFFIQKKHIFKNSSIYWKNFLLIVSMEGNWNQVKVCCLVLFFVFSLFLYIFNFRVNPHGF